MGDLRVTNEDCIASRRGFATHDYRDTGVASGVPDGALAHQDSQDNGEVGAANRGVIRPVDQPRTSGGVGVRPSEFDHDAERTTHFLQIWILHLERGGTPGCEQEQFAAADRRGRLHLVASADGQDGSVTARADACMRAGVVGGDEVVDEPLGRARLAYVHVARSRREVDNQRPQAGDAVTLDGEPQQHHGGRDAEVLAYDLARRNARAREHCAAVPGNATPCRGSACPGGINRAQFVKRICSAASS